MRRRAGVILLALAGLLVGGDPAAASCLQLSLEEQVRSAEVIAYGAIAQDFDRPGPFTGRTVTFRAQRVFKGALPAVAQVRIGPELPASPPLSFAATSVDYIGRAGDHVLYLRVVSGAYETDACSGSHPGAPSEDEQRAFGAGSPPTAASLADEIAALGVLPKVLVVIAIALAAAVLVARRTTLTRREGRIA